MGVGMTKYIAFNLREGVTKPVQAADRKDAHEQASNLWPFDPVSVCTEPELHDGVFFLDHYNQILDWFEGIRAAIPDSNYKEILRCLEAIQEHTQDLRNHFATDPVKGKVP